MDAPKPQNLPLLALFAGVSVLLFFVFAPFIDLIVLAAVFAFLLHAPYERLVRELEGARSLAAGLLVLLLLLFCIAPLFVLGTQIFLEAQATYLHSPGAGVHFVETLQSAVVHYAQRIDPSFAFNISQYVGNVLGFISANLAGLVSGTVYLVFETFLMLLAFFFFLRDGRQLAASLIQASPFGKEETDHIMASLSQTLGAVLKGTLLVAVVRWVLVALAFYFFGIPNAILWGSIGGIVGALPGLGTLIVFIPAVLYLYLEGSALAALGLAIFGVAVIVLVDNILTTYFFGKGLAVPQIFVLFSILGGVLFFGAVGFVMGPLVLSVFLSLLSIYTAANKKAPAH